MANIGKLLKDEIARIARREARQVAAKPRSDAIELKRTIAQLKRQILRLEKAQKPVVKAFEKEVEKQPAAKPEEVRGKWFTGKGVLAQRKRLGLSQKEMAVLAGVSQKAVSHWELKKGKLQLRRKTIEALVAIRDMGRREARAFLATKLSPVKRGRKARGAKKNAPQT